MSDKGRLIQAGSLRQVSCRELCEHEFCSVGWDAAASKLPISELVLDLSKLLECCGQDLSCRQNSRYLIKYSSIDPSIDAAKNQKVREVLS